MIFRKIKFFPVILALSLFAGQACDNDDDDDDDEDVPTSSAPTSALNLTGTVAADARFSTLKTALEKADLLQVLDSGEFTVFAPTNEAFAKIPSGALNALLNDKPALTKVLLYHVVPGSLKADKVLAANELNSANQLSLVIGQDKGVAFVNSSTILSTDILSKNGVIHAIDTVLNPPTLVDIISTDKRFSTLKTALEAADLIGTLQKGEYTVFAPTNEAFAKLGEVKLNSVLNDKVALTSILLYHVVPGSVKSPAVLTGAPLTTANTQVLTPSVLADGSAQINSARILQVDIQSTNGIIHVLDSVLLPK